MIAIIDYKAGNLTSVKLAFDTINADALITDSPNRILAADRVVFPGVGAARSGLIVIISRLRSFSRRLLLSSVETASITPYSAWPNRQRWSTQDRLL